MTTTEKTLRETIAADFDREKWSITAHEAMSRLIASKWQGKKVNKRIETQFKQEFAPDQSMQEKIVTYLDYIGGMCYLQVWGFGPHKHSNESLRLFLGYADLEFHGDGNPRSTRSFNCLTVEGFEENDGCHGEHAKSRNEQRTQLLVNSTLLSEMAKLIDQIKSAKLALEKLGEFGTPGHEAHYAAEKMLKD